MKTTLPRNIILFFLVVFICLVYFYFANNTATGDKQKEIINRIVQHEDIIKKYSRLFNVSPRMYISVIYGELYNNLNGYDEFDETRARIGFDPSIGFSQIRVSTAFWIENNYTGNGIITKSKTKKELVNKLVSRPLKSHFQPEMVLGWQEERNNCLNTVEPKNY